MKKSILLSCIVLIISSISTAQPYSLSVSTSNYNYLSGTSSLNNGRTWDDPTFTIPLGFNFNYFGQQIDTVLIAYGFGGTLMMSLNGSGIASFLSPFGADLIDRGFNFTSGPNQAGSLSPISYQLSGTAGNQLMKIEWKNAGFYSDLQLNGRNAVDSVNFQLWIYENGDRIEVHMGPNHIGSPLVSYDGNSGPDILFAPAVDLVNGLYVGNFYCLDGMPSNPTFQIRSPQNSLLFLQGTIPNGTVYHFIPGLVGEKDNEEAIDLKTYPNPVTDRLNLKFSESILVKSIEIVSLNGKKLMELDPKEVSHDLSKLSSGIYLMVLISDYQRIVKKIQLTKP